MLVGVGSTNPVKVTAARNGFAAVWPETGWSVISCEVASGVSEQPMSNAETILGARNRARRAREQHNVTYGVGIESGLCQIEGAWFSTGWVVVVDASGTEGISSSLIRPVPARIMALVHEGLELGHANDVAFGVQNSKQHTGMIGLLSNNVLTREGVFRDALISALARFVHPEVY